MSECRGEPLQELGHAGIMLRYRLVALIGVDEKCVAPGQHGLGGHKAGQDGHQGERHERQCSRGVPP